jgi:hypothetical protein
MNSVLSRQLFYCAFFLKMVEFSYHGTSDELRQASRMRAAARVLANARLARKLRLAGTQVPCARHRGPTIDKLQFTRKATR